MCTYACAPMHVYAMSAFGCGPETHSHPDPPEARQPPGPCPSPLAPHSQHPLTETAQVSFASFGTRLLSWLQLMSHLWLRIASPRPSRSWRVWSGLRSLAEMKMPRSRMKRAVCRSPTLMFDQK